MKKSEARVALEALYNGISNDTSIQRYSLGWRNILTKIENRYNNIPLTEEVFYDEVAFKALNAIGGKKQFKSLFNDIYNFTNELQLNKHTYRKKSHRKGNHKSPFNIGA
jgi:hypothetical protein